MRNKIAILTIIAGVSAGSTAHAGQLDKQALWQKFAAISHAYALDDLCGFSANIDKTDILAGYLEARWWLWRARAGVEKSIAKKMAEKAWKDTSGGKVCSLKLKTKFKHGIANLDDFVSVATKSLGTPDPSLLNPKPNQMHIFASYQMARKGWILAKKCNFASPHFDLDQYLVSLNARRKAMLDIFRPDQLAGLEKNTNEMTVSGSLTNCNGKTKNLAELTFAQLTKNSFNNMIAAPHNQRLTNEIKTAAAFDFKFTPSTFE